MCLKNLALLDDTDANAVSRISRISFLDKVTEMYSKGRFFLGV